MSGESITCPVCGMTSYNPNDVRERYCGNCHAFTSAPCIATAEDLSDWKRCPICNHLPSEHPR